MAQSVKMTGYVLRKNLLPSHDVVVHLYTREFGKLSTIAKGLRAATSKRGAQLQSGNLIHGSCIERDQLSLLTDTALISAFSAIKNDWHRSQCMYSLLMTIDRLAPPYAPEPEIYHIVHETMIRLATTSEPAAVFTRAGQLLIETFGYGSTEISDVYGALEQLIDEKLPIRDIISHG